MAVMHTKAPHGGSVLKRLRQALKNNVTEKKQGIEEMANVRWYQSYVHAPGKAVWMPREYGKFADEAYIRNVIAYRCINLITQGAASVPWKLFRIEQDAKEELRQHPLLKLLAMPNPCQSNTEFFENLYSCRMISGNAFVQAVSASGLPPRELHILRPDRMSVISGKDCMPQGYQYAVGNNVRRFNVDRANGHSAILHLKTFHPLNDWYGLSPVEAAAYSIDQHNQAAQWNQALLQNGARPSGALVVKSPNGEPALLSQEQYTRLKAQIEEQFIGAGNAGRPLLLEGGLDWKEMSLSPKDMDFIESRHSAARDIALAFGVPPQLLGIPGDNTYSNLMEARIALWEQSILPLVENVVGAFNNWLKPMFGENLLLASDADSISALAPKRDKVWARIEKSTCMTINEKRHMLGLAPVDGGDMLDR